MAHDSLNVLVIHAKRIEGSRNSAAESVPAMPVGKGIIAFEEMAFRLVTLVITVPNKLVN